MARLCAVRMHTLSLYSMMVPGAVSTGRFRHVSSAKGRAPYMHLLAKALQANSSLPVCVAVEYKPSIEIVAHCMLSSPCILCLKGATTQKYPESPHNMHAQFSQLSRNNASITARICVTCFHHYNQSNTHRGVAL